VVTSLAMQNEAEELQALNLLLSVHRVSVAEASPGRAAQAASKANWLMLA